MLNPSVADGKQDDSTIRRCVGFSKRWGYGGLIVVNLFALRATDPAELYCHDYPVGPRNESVLARTLDQPSVKLVVAAWGSHGNLMDRDRIMLRMARDLGKAVMCLGTTKDGRPRHPLRLAAAAVPTVFTGRPLQTV